MGPQSFGNRPVQLLYTVYDNEGYGPVDGQFTPNAGMVTQTSTKARESNSKGRVNLGTRETLILIEIWGEKYAQLKGASHAIKRKIWEKIYFEFQSACAGQNVPISKKTVDQLKKRVSNLKYDYRQIRAGMASTGEEGANKLKRDFPFFDAMDGVLGSRDAANPDLMSVESTWLAPLQMVETQAVPAPTYTATGEPQKAAGDKGKRLLKRKRQQATEPESSNSGEDPHMKLVCQMWQPALV